MRLALLYKSAADATSSGGLLLRLRAWFAAVCVADRMPARDHDEDELKVVRNDTVPGAVLLPFPIRGEALLVKLAELLRARIATVALSPNVFLLTMSRAPRSCLAIDHASYIAFDAERAAFHVVLEARPDTTITLDTTNFDTLVQFVVEYVNGRISEFRTLEVAS